MCPRTPCSNLGAPLPLQLDGASRLSFPSHILPPTCGRGLCLGPQDRSHPPEPNLHAVFAQDRPDVGRNWVDLGDIRRVNGRKCLQPSSRDLPRNGCW